MKRNYLFLSMLLVLSILLLASACSVETDTTEQNEQNENNLESNGENEQNQKDMSQEEEIKNEEIEQEEEEPGFVNPYTFEYPEAVRGIYATGHSVGGSRFQTLLELMDTTELNAMVIDIKDDKGHITFRLDEDSPYYEQSKNYIGDIDSAMEDLEKHEVYPIARIVVFKDNVLAEKQPELSFKRNGSVWTNSNGHAFVNPFLKEVWDYNIDIAKIAAEKGFREIQFDYVRFPEGFERMESDLNYDWADYSPTEVKQEDGTTKVDMGSARVQAVTDFVEYASSELQEYNVDVSVDIFGYTAVDTNAHGIGQDFLKISENVDIISSMIYPSHWGPYYFGIPKPDLEPYRLTKEYAKVENIVLNQLDDPPISRPWIQAFTASYLPRGNYMTYGAKEIEEQIRALNEMGIWEFLLWNAGNTYVKDANYTPIGFEPENYPKVIDDDSEEHIDDDILEDNEN